MLLGIFIRKSTAPPGLLSGRGDYMEDLFMEIFKENHFI